MCTVSLRLHDDFSNVWWNLSEFCKDCLITCVLVTSVVDETDGDCLWLVKPDSELTPSEHHACPSATWVQSRKLKGLRCPPRNYKNSRHLIVNCVQHTSRQKGGNAWKKICDDSMLKASINFAIGCGLQETYVSTWALSLLAKRSISGLSNKAKILWNMGNERIHSRFKITGLHQHCWTLEYGLPTNKKIIYLAHSKTCFISYNLWWKLRKGVWCALINCNLRYFSLPR